jgi:putative flippase GtrA
VDAQPAVRTRAEWVKDKARSPGGRKMIKYTLVSVISVIVSQIVLAILLFGFHWSGRNGQILACSVATVPSYYLNRTWVWGKGGRSHLMKEVAPFWTLAFIGLAFSTWCADYADSHADEWVSDTNTQKLIVMAFALGAFGVLWLGKFVIFNKILFVHHPEELEEIPALDGRTGIPT